ncbi:hypothetical protein [Chryseobacterium vrystaatense]|uniref:Outer membrane protein beta-barrel domain-containing protein n=1 Tax=Chryseobacterium vrystaatense TaxID=307480 RepID=A0ABR4UHB9_9FLAO|nr:hypothetical protein [Chryseobacterium vrystaatense]KFF23471.1 hypothetical protein IW16_24750 [Chryseobacterium vrystaatense]
MIKMYFSIMLFTCALAFSQEKKEINKSVTGIQAGFIGVDLYNETRISEKISLRSQISFNPSIWGGDLYSRTGFALAPSISIAPKYYYNFDNRVENGRNTKNNAGSFVSLKLEYTPDLFVISNVDNIHVNEMLALIPNWGMRRNFAENFNYELRLGLGLGKIIKGGYNVQVVPEISFKVGYDF